ASLTKAFAGSTVIFGVTDLWEQVGNPKVQERAQKSSRQSMSGLMTSSCNKATTSSTPRMPLLNLGPPCAVGTLCYKQGE
ncbi:hypothetical protein B0O99DRAFT_529337, partial [Bisporella sp. PMI_857]